MGNIVLLDELTINKIAAGEVIERPASVVKELVENSIDAKATAITVEIKNGGISYIKITDNGNGIRKDDVSIAFERHATSKIRSADDLHKIISMGFRGEALASIAAVSKCTLQTCNVEEDVGTKIIVEGGKILDFQDIGHPKGTTITIENIFYNTPARYKFLKKDYTEAGYIEDNIIRLAIANPLISFKYINNGKVIIQTAGNGDIKTILYNIFGKDLATNLLEVKSEVDNIKLTGVVGNPNINRSSRTNQFFYINKRYIKDKVLSSSIDEAYRTMLPQGKFAFCALNIEINPQTVDVNVHPAKLEVRFQDESQIFRIIYNTVREKLNKRTDDNNPFVSKDVEKYNIDKTYDLNIKESYNIKNNIDNQNIPDEISEENKISIYSLEEKEVEDNLLYNYNEDENKEYNIVVFENKENHDNKDIKNLEKEEKNCTTPENKIQKSSSIKYDYIGVLWNTYIIIQIQNEMYIIDQHAAHERIIYERLMDKAKNNIPMSQMLLIPIVLKVTNKEKQNIFENLEQFEKAGYIVDEFGENDIKISGVPDISLDIDYKSMFMDIVDEIEGISRTNSKIIFDKFIYTVACKAAVKANMFLHKDEIERLLSEMMNLESPFTCPHGRPTAIKMSKYEIERKFLRK